MRDEKQIVQRVKDLRKFMLMKVVVLQKGLSTTKEKEKIIEGIKFKSVDSALEKDCDMCSWCVKDSWHNSCNKTPKGIIKIAQQKNFKSCYVPRGCPIFGISKEKVQFI